MSRKRTSVAETVPERRSVFDLVLAVLHLPPGLPEVELGPLSGTRRTLVVSVCVHIGEVPLGGGPPPPLSLRPLVGVRTMAALTGVAKRKCKSQLLWG